MEILIISAFFMISGQAGQVRQVVPYNYTCVSEWGYLSNLSNLSNRYI